MHLGDPPRFTLQTDGGVGQFIHLFTDVCLHKRDSLCPLANIVENREENITQSLNSHKSHMSFQMEQVCLEPKKNVFSCALFGTKLSFVLAREGP